MEPAPRLRYIRKAYKDPMALTGQGILPADPLRGLHQPNGSGRGGTAGRSGQRGSPMEDRSHPNMRIEGRKKLFTTG
jgi:hypothetical protein